MDKAIELSKITFSWPGNPRPVLDIDHLSVLAGERFFIQGPSGCGKSTLLSLLSGVLTPQSGTVTVLDQPMHELSASDRDRFRGDHMGYIFQQFNLVPYLSVIENVTLPCRFSVKRMSRCTHVEEEALRLLEHLGLQDLLHRSVTELSVGQQQRVAAARALLGSPGLIIADEPTSALDTANREMFIELLFQECNRDITTLIFVSHDESLGSLFDRTFQLQSQTLNAKPLSPQRSAKLCDPSNSQRLCDKNIPTLGAAQ